jgi:hypothetical protein
MIINETKIVIDSDNNSTTNNGVSYALYKRLKKSARFVGLTEDQHLVIVTTTDKILIGGRNIHRGKAVELSENVVMFDGDSYDYNKKNKSVMVVRKDKYRFEKAELYIPLEA